MPTLFRQPGTYHLKYVLASGLSEDEAVSSTPIKCFFKWGPRTNCHHWGEEPNSLHITLNPKTLQTFLTAALRNVLEEIYPDLSHGFMVQGAASWGLGLGFVVSLDP